ncbi:MAG: Mpo1-like protein [Limnobacter sp.]|nr:Mpo1-like protein [Limnobacter sp.]
MINAFATLKEQRWDDHRLYHHSRINQTLHLISACSFLLAYAMLWVNPAAAALIAWLIAMTTRQIGHFVFEPRGYDHNNQMTFDYKEQIKVGYNLNRKVVLLTVWAGLPLFLLIDPSLLGFLQPHRDLFGFAMNVGWAWFWLGVAGVVFRTVHLFFISGLETGMVWFLKILTDPLHDIKIYWRSPFFLLKGQWVDPEHGRVPH